MSSAYRRIAKAYTTSVLAKCREVVGVALLGGGGRGYADDLSEIDLAIFMSERPSKSLPKGEHRWRGHLFDNDLYLYRQEAKTSWSQERKQAFSEAKIILDTRGLVRKLLRRKLRFSGTERRNIILQNLLFFEDRIEDAERIWPRRGHLPSAHYAINMAVESLLRLLFAYNGRFLPSDKWRLYYSYHLPWLPKDYRTRIIDIMTAHGIRSVSLGRRVAALKQLDEALRERLHEDGMLPKDVYRYCVEKIWATW